MNDELARQLSLQNAPSGDAEPAPSRADEVIARDGEPAEEAVTPATPEAVHADPAPGESRHDASAPAADSPAEAAEPPAATVSARRGSAPTDTARAGQAESSGESADDVPIQLEWYILKVQSNREDSIREGLLRRVAMAGLDRYFGEVIVPTEMVTEFKGGKKRVVKRKLYPGYIVVHMEINDDTWYLVRETAGIGDFTGSIGRPTPMAPQDVAKILSKTEEKTDDQPKLNIKFKKGDRVKINEGTFENFEGEVDGVDEANGRVTVMINIFGRSTPVELEYWQVESV